MADVAQTESIPTLRETVTSKPAERPRPASRIRRFGSWLAAPDSRAVVYLGLVLVVFGFAVIAFAWSKVAGTLSVPLQIPYIASGGFAGLALVIIGIGVLSIGVKRRENFDRVRELEKLSTTMESIRESVAATSDESDTPS
jgi:hypothetical protein